MRDDLHSLVCSAPLTVHPACRQPPATVPIYLSHRPFPFPALLQTPHLFSSRSPPVAQSLPHYRKQPRKLDARAAVASKLPAPSGLRQRCRQWLLCTLNSAQRFMPYQQIPSAQSISTISNPRGSTLLFPAVSACVLAPSRKVPHKWISSSWHFLTTFVALHSLFLISIRRGHLQ